MWANRATYTARPGALSTPDSPESPKICPRNPALSLTVRAKAAGEAARAWIDAWRDSKNAGALAVVGGVMLIAGMWTEAQSEEYWKITASVSIVATAAKQLKERGGGRCLVSICTAGGMGVVAILER